MRSVVPSLVLALRWSGQALHNGRCAKQTAFPPVANFLNVGLLIRLLGLRLWFGRGSPAQKFRNIAI